MIVVRACSKFVLLPDVIDVAVDIVYSYHYIGPEIEEAIFSSDSFKALEQSKVKETLMNLVSPLMIF